MVAERLIGLVLDAVATWCAVVGAVGILRVLIGDWRLSDDDETPEARPYILVSAALLAAAVLLFEAGRLMSGQSQ